MQIAKTLAVLALMFAPTFASAQGCSGDQKEASMSCAEGLVWNAETKACEASTS